ncbi:hypothetical protein TcCL_NonESM11257, partial [Trypanosoma cruzi]
QEAATTPAAGAALSLSLSCLREVNIPPATADCAIVTLHARRGCVNTSCSLQRLKRCLTPSTKCIDAGRASAVREDHNDVRVTESQHVCCDAVAWHLHTHTHAAPVPLPFVSALCRSGQTPGQQQNHFTLDNPKSTPTSLATQRSRLPARASCRSAIDAETRHSARTYFPSCAVSRLLHTFFDGLTSIKARHKSHCDRTRSCDERRCVHGSAAHTCWQAACSRCPRASSSAPARKRENGLFPMHLFPPAAPTRWSPAVIPQHIQECRKVTWNCQPETPQFPHTCRLHQIRHKLQTTTSTCLPNIIPTHRDTPNRSIRHSMHLLTQSHSPCTTHGSSSHVVKQMFLGSVLPTCCGGK